jgi:hypothetical protein
MLNILEMIAEALGLEFEATLEVGGETIVNIGDDKEEEEAEC